MGEIDEYYARRAAEYEDVYLKPERQHDLEMLRALLGSAFAGMDVLEAACGTGYWTQVLARSARSILATDIAEEVMEFARRKDYGTCRVAFTLADAYDLDGVDFRGNAGFHGFWWSHIPIQRIPDFLKALHAKLAVGSKVVMLDNGYIEGSSTPISRTDQAGNTYQMRRLQDGSRYEVLKNFPSKETVQELLAGWVGNIKVRCLEYYWLVEYRVTADGSEG